MKEITRIHIAKVPYDAEVEAKKELDVYLKALEAYSDDADIMDDIELRITEILAERNIRKGGVITKDDIKALKQQLGEPRDFMGDGDIAVGDVNDEAMGAQGGRKLFRDTDRAVLGGVLAGIGAFFKINPALVRIIFIIVALASFGTALLVYVVLWVAVPAAKTAADKLQMAGRPVTISSIREMNESDAGKSLGDNGQGRRVATAILGVLCVFGAMGAAAVTVSAVLAAIFGLGSERYVLEGGTGGNYFMGAFILAAVSGVLLTVLFILGAYASFAQKLSRRVLISVCAVIVAGMLTFSGAIGLAKYGSYKHGYFIESNTRSQAVPMPDAARTVNGLTVKAEGVRVEYIVTDEAPSAKLQAVVRQDADMPKVEIGIEGKTLRVSATQGQNDNCGRMLGWCYAGQPVLEIHGPAVMNLTAEETSGMSYQPTAQEQLVIDAKADASVDILSGTVKRATIETGTSATVSVAQATVESLDAKSIGTSSTIEAGTVRSLAVRDSGSCPAHSMAAQVSVWKVTGGSITLNDKQKPARSFDTGCTDVTIEGEDNRD